MSVLALAACTPTPPGATLPSTVTVTRPLTTTSALANPNQAEQIQAVFSDFMKAVVDKNGDAATAFLTNDAIARWETYRVHALKSTEADLAGLPVAERAIVYGLRATVGDSLRTATGRTVVASAVQQGLIFFELSSRKVNADGTTTVDKATPVLRNIVVDGDTATAEMASDDPVARSFPTPIRFTFLREGEGWKIDPIGVADMITLSLDALAAYNGVTAEQALINGYTNQYGAARAAEILKPLDG